MRGARHHDGTDLPVGRLALVLGGTAVFVVASALTLWLLMASGWAFTPGSGPGAIRVAPPAPGTELERVNRRLQRRLDSYGWVDRSAGIVHVPIEAAMARLVREPGLLEPQPAVP